MNSISFNCYQDAIMLTEEARLLVQKMDKYDDEEQIHLDVGDERKEDSVRLARNVYLRALNIFESVSGWCNEDVAKVYYELGWLEYDYAANYERALGYLLQSLRISHQLYDENDWRTDNNDHHDDDDEHYQNPVTMVVLDDIQDLLDDMGYDEEHANKVFHSWELQDQAEDLLKNTDETREESALSLDYRTPSPALALYKQALQELPITTGGGLELERAYIYGRMARLASKQHFSEDAMSYYCSALMRLPNWLQRDHPTIRTLIKESRVVAKEQLTPICGTRRSDMVLEPIDQGQEEEGSQIVLLGQRRQLLRTNKSSRDSFTLRRHSYPAEIRVANE